jgi:hydroxypyruvate reductase
MRRDLERIFRAGVEACLPKRVLPPLLPEAPPNGRTILLAVGKAAAGMAQVADSRLAGTLTGCAVVPHGTEAALERVELIHAGHPIPDQASVAAAERLLALARSAGGDDLVLVLLSGGASALAALPGPGLALAEKQRLVAGLLKSGASIADINCVRRHLSAIKGGRLALSAAPARIVTLAISDVVGNAPEAIGSGPTVPDSSTIADAKAVLARYDLTAPAAGWSETPEFSSSPFRIVADNKRALRAAAAEAEHLGYTVQSLGECEGEARELGDRHARLALEAAPGAALISGGELIVRVTGAGRGGPNHEYALAAALRLAGRQDIAGLAADTDGLDGTGLAAGAYFDGGSTARSDRNAAAALADNDSGAFFAALGDQLVTGPTGTNVNDLRIILVAP